jgi:hypothetical protein
MTESAGLTIETVMWYDVMYYVQSEKPYESYSSHIEYAGGQKLKINTGLSTKQYQYMHYICNLHEIFKSWMKD